MNCGYCMCKTCMKQFNNCIHCSDCIRENKQVHDIWYCPKYMRKEHLRNYNLCEEVYGRGYDTAGNYHWYGTYTGHHVIEKETVVIVEEEE